MMAVKAVKENLVTPFAGRNGIGFMGDMATEENMGQEQAGTLVRWRDSPWVAEGHNSRRNKNADCRYANGR